MSQKSNFNREEGRQLCKKYGIKANISNKDMEKCIRMTEKGISVPTQFKKISWFQKHSSPIAVAAIGLAITLIGFIYWKRNLIL